MQKTLVKTCDYFPSIDWFRTYVHAPHCSIAVHRSYQRRGMENRCNIGSAQGPLALTVPLLGGRNQHKPLHTIQIAYHTRWQHQQAQAIRSAYGRAPFFEHYYRLFEPVFTNTFPSLVQMNLFIINQSLKALKIEPHHIVLDNPNTLIEEIKASNELPTPKEYLQPFSERHGFIPHLSLLDLLFCSGPASLQYL